MSDIFIKCIECGKTFALNEGQQSFYEMKGFALPKRCKGCRERKKYEVPSSLGLKTSSFFEREQTCPMIGVKGGLDTVHVYYIKCDEDKMYLSIDAEAGTARLIHDQHKALCFRDKNEAIKLCDSASKLLNKEFHIVSEAMYVHLRDVE